MFEHHEVQQVHVQLEEVQGLLKLMTVEADDRMMSTELENLLHIISNHSCTVGMQQYLTPQFEELKEENQQLKVPGEI